MRSEVSGVRSSWPASATSWRCRSREAASAASIWLKAVASRAISSSPSTGSGRRSSVRAISSTDGGQPADRPQAVAGHAPAGHAGGDDAGEAEEEHHQAELAQHRLLGVQGLREDHRVPARGGGRPRPASDRRPCRDGADRPGVLALRDVGLGGAEGGRAPRRWRTPRAARGRSRRPRRSRRAGSATGTVPSRCCRRRPPTVEDSARCDQRVVQRGLHLHPDRDVGAERDERDGEADRDRGQQGDPAGERPAVVPGALGLGAGGTAHDSFST